MAGLRGLGCGGRAAACSGLRGWGCYRSIFPKDYNGEEVDRQVILEMLEAANWAPNHGEMGGVVWQPYTHFGS